MIPITIYARLDACAKLMVSDRDNIEPAVLKWAGELEAAARVACPRASICEETAHVEVHPGSDHLPRGETVIVELGDRYIGRSEEPLTGLTLQQCMNEELHCLGCFADGRCKICGFTPNAGAAFGTDATLERSDAKRS